MTLNSSLMRGFPLSLASQIQRMCSATRITLVLFGEAIRGAMTAGTY
jgi:hypothetical protein